MNTGRPDRRVMSPLAFAVVGTEMVAFTLAGLAIDWFAGWTPWATVGLTLLGLVAAMAHIIRMASPAGQGRPPDPGGP
jgi:F0F1-type ATP synthase assembly protein I